MQKYETMARMAKTRLMAVLRVDSLEEAFKIARGLKRAGADILEVSYTSVDATARIRELSEAFPDLLVGAGTVLDSETAKLAIDAGAKFIIAPTFSKEVALIANRYQIPYCPGCSSYTEMVDAMSYGAAYVKCFPISTFYGPEMVKTLKTPLPFMPILVSGGITLDNIDEWLEEGADCLAMSTLLTKGTEDEIAENAAAVMAHIRKYS